MLDKKTLVILCVLCVITFFLILYNSDIEEEYDWSFIDKVIYINLNERTDRRELIEKELVGKISPDKIYRFEAIRDNPGHIGCTKSHIGVLELAIQNGWENYLVVEDDAMFHKYKKGYQTLKKLVEEHPNYNVITLGNVNPQFDKNTLRLYSGQTTTSYLVNRPYYEKLLSNFKEGLRNLEVTKGMASYEERYPIEQQYAIDQYWKNLQKTDEWYIVNPALMIQRPDKSSIIDQVVDYTSHFNL